jgi:phosphatidylglycerol:prolipoprotein diacylglycerol transferase
MAIDFRDLNLPQALPPEGLGPFHLFGQELGPVFIRVYALSYIVGLLIGWLYCRWLTRRPPHTMSKQQIDDFFLWAMLGVVLGGRIGYILFYNPGFFLAHPLQIFVLWQGGMSFHGGLIGVILAMILYTRKLRLPFFALADIVACATPIGLFLGRLANFVNGELFGRATGTSWGIVFPGGGEAPRHPSQLYEAFLEGIVLFIVMFVLVRFTRAKAKLGVLSGAFLVGYGLCRIGAELFREPDPQLGFLFNAGVTMGQLLSVPMLIMGTLFVLWAKPAVK